MASRRKSRERALQVLFLLDMRNEQPVEEALEAYGYTLHSEDEDFGNMTRDKFMEHLVRGTVQQRADLDQRIGKASSNWRLDRMPTVDRNILRLATFELLEAKLPPPVIIDEALELARKFSGNESVGFVNGVLDAIRTHWKSDSAESAKAEAEQTTGQAAEQALAAGATARDGESG